jgi:hypothetical protein
MVLKIVGLRFSTTEQTKKKRSVPVPEFFQTMMGRKFYESDMPRIASALEKIATALGDKEMPATNAVELLAKLHTRIHQEELAGHFSYSLIRDVADCVEGVHTDSMKEKVLVMDRRDRIHAYDGPDEQPTLQNILDICDYKPANGIPGVCFPTNHSGIHAICDSKDGRVFIAKDDQAGMFASDVDAANFVTCLIGKPWKKFFDNPPEKYFYPYFEMTLNQVSALHDKFRKIAESFR